VAVRWTRSPLYAPVRYPVIPRLHMRLMLRVQSQAGGQVPRSIIVPEEKKCNRVSEGGVDSEANRSLARILRDAFRSAALCRMSRLPDWAKESGKVPEGSQQLPDNVLIWLHGEANRSDRDSLIIHRIST